MNDELPRSGRKSLGKMGVREIAKRAGVAPMTVSRALSNPDSVAPATRPSRFSQPSA